MQLLARSLLGVAFAASLAAGAAMAAAPPPVQVKRLPAVRPITPAVAVAPDRLQLLREVEAGRVELRDITLGEPVRLDLRKGFVDGVASIEFDYAANVSPADNTVTFERLAGDHPSRARINFRAPAAGIYIVDVGVTGHAGHGGEGERTITLENLGAPVQAQALKVGPHRAMYFVEASAPGPMLMVVQSKSSAWTFRSVEISQLK